MNILKNIFLFKKNLKNIEVSGHEVIDRYKEIAKQLLPIKESIHGTV